MKKANGIHWLAPTIIVGSLILGALLALGHHLFYSSLRGTTARDDNLHILYSQVSRQQLNTAAGTAFAFLVKAALTSAVSTAYIQIFWRVVTRASRPATLESLDTTFSAPTSVLSLYKVWIWWQYPLLFSLAVTAWSV